jgi:radical SAM superfamily enzyme YgiQ (UPF0313 family)
MKKRILFINMPIREHAPPKDIPLGPLSLSSYINSKEYESTILDLNLYRPNKNNIYKDLYNTILNKFDNQNVILLSGLITTLKYQEIVAKIIREISNSTYIVSGGGLATDIKSLLFEWIPELNAINIGPGEQTILDIIKHSENEGKKIYIGKSTDIFERIVYYKKLWCKNQKYWRKKIRVVEANRYG